MRTAGAQRTDTECGQASVEFLGSLPAALLVVMVGWQLFLAGQATWLVGNAARVAARADAVGDDPVAAARSALPEHLRRHLELDRSGTGRVGVHVRMPLILERWSAPLEIGASAELEERS
jgi:pilus assembly protein CpaE